MKENLNTSEPLVLLIGTIDSEGIKSTLKASGRQYKIKRLDSSADNWKSIVAYFEEYEVRCVIIKLTGFIYEHLAQPNYFAVRDKLFESLINVPHAIFVHEELLSGRSLDTQSATEEDLDRDEYGIRSSLHFPGEKVRSEVNNFLLNRGLNILSYTSNAELTVSASTFISDAEEGLLFRFYVPNGRLWANETDRLVQLFRDYLTRIEKLSVRFDQHRTDRGIIYEFWIFGNCRSSPNIL